jgi:rare lipoprotein A
MKTLALALALLVIYYGGGDGYCGRKTASGERYDCGGMTAAHRTLPFGTHVNVCGVKCATVRINDRGPYAHGASIDLSMAAARVICGGLRSCKVRILHKGYWGL